MNSYEITLIAQPQLLSVSLNGVTYQLSVYWSIPGQCWFLDIMDSSGNDIVTGIPMVTGVDLLGQSAYLGIGGALIMQCDGADPLASPTFANLGTVASLYFVPFSS